VGFSSFPLDKSIPLCISPSPSSSRTMSDSPSHRVVEKCTKKYQDVGGSSSQAKKPRARKVMLCVPPPVPSAKEEEDPSSRRTQVNYMREDSQTIINQRNIPCYESAKESLDPHFWSYFHAGWYWSVYESKQTLMVPM
jgi:hypothetical protein